jgi:hypothetical protein
MDFYTSLINGLKQASGEKYPILLRRIETVLLAQPVDTAAYAYQHLLLGMMEVLVIKKACAYSFYEWREKFGLDVSSLNSTTDRLFIIEYFEHLVQLFPTESIGFVFNIIVGNLSKESSEVSASTISIADVLLLVLARVRNHSALHQYTGLLQELILHVKR